MSDFRFQQRDFLGILDDMKSYYKDRMGENWTDLSEADPAIALLEAFAYSCKNLHYYVDQQKRESDIVTAVRARNVYWKAVRDGYNPHGYMPCTGTVLLKFSENTDSGVTIPRHTTFQTNYENPESNIIVTTLDEQVLSEEAINITEKSTFSVSVAQGIWRTETKTRSDITQNGYIKLNTEKVAYNVGMVEFYYSRTVGEAPIIFEQVEDVYTDYRTGYFFSVHPLFLRNTITTMVQLPYNWPDLFDTDGTITIGYLETDGVDGYIPKSTYNEYENTWKGGVSLLNDTIYDNSEPPVNVTPKITSIYNISTISGGQNIESINSIKINAKTSIREIDTLITLEDYADYIRTETATNVTALDISKDTTIPGRYIYVYIELNSEDKTGYVPFNLNNKPVELTTEEYIYNYMTLENWNLDPGKEDYPHSYTEFWKDKLGGIVDKVNQKRGRRDVVLFQTSTEKLYNISANIYLSGVGDSPETIMSKIEEKLMEELGQVPQIGKTHYMSKIISILQESSDRVESVELITPDTDIRASEIEVPIYNIKAESIRFKFLSGEPDVLLPENLDNEE